MVGQQVFHSNLQFFFAERFGQNRPRVAGGKFVRIVPPGAGEQHGKTGRASQCQISQIPDFQRIDIDKVRQDRDAIWKAAVLAYRNGDPCFLDSETAARASRSNLDFAEDEHSWTNSIATWLSLPINAQGPHHSDDILRGAGVIALDRVPASGDYRELQRAMQHVPGWIKDREPTRHNGKKARYWRKAGT